MADRYRRLFWLTLFAGFLLLPGCDTVDGGDDLVILTREITTAANAAPIRFTFEADDLDTDAAVTLSCDCSVNLGPWLTSQGFGKGDIVRAEIQSARLTLLLPVSERLTFLDSAVLKLDTDASSPVEVATGSGFGAVRDASLSPVSGRNVAAVISADAFEPLLELVPASLRAGEEYELGVSLTVRVELESF